MHKNILIISDIEGSSGCWDYNSSSFKTQKWAEACVDMSFDVDSVVKAIFDAGAESVLIKDFHRTGYNLLPELIDSRAKLISGYKIGPVPGLGNPGKSTGLIMLGMHAASGSSGFLAHTMTSRIEKLEVNGKLMSEAAADSLSNIKTEPYYINGPFSAVLTMRDGESTAIKLAKRWGFSCKNNEIFLDADDIHELYYSLIRICYLTPFIEKILPAGIIFYNLMGRYGQRWVRQMIG